MKNSEFFHSKFLDRL